MGVRGAGRRRLSDRWNGSEGWESVAAERLGCPCPRFCPTQTPISWLVGWTLLTVQAEAGNCHLPSAKQYLRELASATLPDDPAEVRLFGEQVQIRTQSLPLRFGIQIIQAGAVPHPHPRSAGKAAAGVALANVDLKPVREPDAGKPHVRFDERVGETGWLAAAAPRLDSTDYCSASGIGSPWSRRKLSLSQYPR
jgi:hypothetical protein